MSIEEIKALDDRKLDRRIAEALGWTNVKATSSGFWDIGTIPNGQSVFPVPQYSSSLDTAFRLQAELERRDLQDAFGKALESLLGGALMWEYSQPTSAIFAIANCPARTRAEAALMTLMEAAK